MIRHVLIGSSPGLIVVSITHTSDGIVVWIPKEKVLFGGNEIRNINGWVENIGDANLSEWSNTAIRIKEVYGEARLVVPGHGKTGSVELIDYTINLYNFNKNVTSHFNYSDQNVSDTIENFLFKASSKTIIHNEIKFEFGEAVYLEESGKIELAGELLVYNLTNKTLFIPKGHIHIRKGERSVMFNFNQLYFTLREDAVEKTIVIKEVHD